MKEAEIGGFRGPDQPTIEGGKDGFAHGGAVFQNVGVPEAQRGVASQAHERIAPTITRIIGMLAAVDFDDELPIPAREIPEIRTDWKLACELITAKPAKLEFKPQQRFGLIVALPQIASAFRRAGFATASPRFAVFSPHSVAAARRHLSPRCG